MSDFIIKINFQKDKKTEDLSISPSDLYQNEKDINVNYYSHDLFESILVNSFIDDETTYFENENFFIVSSIISGSSESSLKLKKDENSSEKILDLFLAEQHKFLSKISIPFSFVILNKKSREVYISRDQMGLKSIFYYKNSSNLYISSNLRFLISQSIIPKKINKTRIADFLEMKISCDSYTFYEEIKKLPSSSFLTLKCNKSSDLIKYDSFKGLKKNQHNIEETAKNLRKLLERALNKLLFYTPNKIGFLFSGGLDSSSLISLFRENKSPDQKIFAFTTVYEDMEKNLQKNIDEKIFQDEIINLNKGEIEQVKFNGAFKTTLDDIKVFLEVIGEPFFFPNLCVTYNCYLDAKKNSVHSVINGNDGDTVISHGFELLVELFFSFRWIKLNNELNQISKRINVSKKLIFKRIIVERFFLKFKTFVLDRLNLKVFLHEPLLANKDFLKSTDFYKLNKSKAPKIKAFSHHKSVLKQFLHFDAIEKQSAVASYLCIQEHYPFYDMNLIKYCLSIDPSFKLRDGYQRFILREAMKGLLPEKNRLRLTKADLSVALTWSYNNKNKKFIEDNIHNTHKYLISKINKQKLTNAWNKIKENPKKMTGSSKELSIIFSYVVLNYWLFKLS